MVRRSSSRPRSFSPSLVPALAFLAFAPFAALAGCGGGKLKVDNPFTSRADLEAIAAGPASPVPPRKVASAPKWTVEPNDTPQAPTALEAQYEALTSVRGGSRSVRCVARELARFNAERGAAADERFQRFITGACGATASVEAYSFQFDLPTEMSEEEALPLLQGKVALPASVRSVRGGTGVAKKGKSLVVVAVTPDNGDAELETTVGQGGVVTVRGQVRTRADQVFAFVNQGVDGVARCEPDAATALPAFAFTCKAAPSDPSTWVEVAIHAPGRLLAHSIGHALVRLDPSVPFALASEAASAGSAKTGTSAVLEGVNRVRVAAKLAPLTVAPQQSAVNERLAPYYFEAAHKHDVTREDQVALGLLAGWEVPGTIRNGGLFSAYLSGAGDASSWIDYALDTPLGRSTLLEPNARQIAIGATHTPGGVGAIVTTYSFFGAEDALANAQRVLARVVRERASRGLPKPASMGQLASLSVEATAVRAGEREAMEGLDRAMKSEVARLGRGVHGWAVLAQDLDTMPLPKELFAPGPLTVSAEVTHYKAEGAAWGTYLVYFLVHAEVAQQVAKNASDSRATGGELLGANSFVVGRPRM